MKTCSKFFIFIALLFLQFNAAAQCDGIFLNEIHYDNIGTDVDEFIEVAVPVAVAVLNLADYEVTLYNGSNGTNYASETLNNFVFGSTDGTFDYYTWNPGSIQNGSPDGFGLSKQGVHCEFLSYEGSFTATGGPATGVTSTDLGVDESNSSTMPGFSLQLIGGVAGIWQGPTVATKGAQNMVSCSITSVFVSNPMCTGSDFTFEVNFSVVGGSGTYEVIDVTNGGTILGSGSASPIVVTIPNNSSTTPFDVTVWDQADNTCVDQSPATVNPLNCVSCTISGVAVSNDMCTGTDFTFDVAFTASLGSGTYDVIDVTNGNAVLASGTTSPITVTIANNTSTTPFDVDVWDQNDNTCVSGSPVTVNPIDCSSPASCNGIFLNEIHYDDAGSDDNEFIEVAVDNSVSVALSTFTVTLYNGNGGVTYDSEIVSNFVMGMNDGTYTYYTWEPPSGIQNGAPDGFSLSTGALLCEFLSYEGTITAANGPAAGTTSTDIGVSESGNPEGLSLQLIGGVWTGPIGETAGDTNGGCSISGVSVTSANCVGADFVFEVAFSESMGSGNYEVIDVTNANAVLGSGTTSPITVTIPNNTSTTPFDINVWDAADNTCAGTAVTVNPIDCSVVISCDAMLNEIHYDNSGSDIGEFIEVAVDATVLVNLANYTVSLYNGSNGTVYDSETLDNFTVGNNDGTYVYYTWYPSSIQNGAPDGFALTDGSTVCEFLSYEGTFLATNGPALGVTSTDIGVSEGSNAAGTSLQLIGGVWVGPIPETPGDTNVAAAPCSITNVAVSNAGCVGLDYVFEVSFDVLNGSGQYVVIDVTNGNAMIGGGSASPITVTIPNNSSTTPFDINVWDNNDNTCVGPTPVTVTPDDCSIPPVSCSGVFLNEIHYDNFGGDINEFIEVAVDNSVPVTLSDFTVSLYNGSAGLVYDMETLDNLTLGNNDGTYTYYTWNPASMQNGAPDGFALTVPGTTCELLSYEGTFTATDGPANGSASTDLGVFEDGTDAPGLSLQLIGGVWVGPTADTYGDTNKNCPTSLNLTGTEIGIADYETSGDIISDQTIDATAQVDYDAVTSITLNPGFNVQVGGVFYAFIDGCNDGAGGINLTEDAPADSEDQ